MRRFLSIFALASGLAFGPAIAGDESKLDGFIKRSRDLVIDFQGSLKGELQAAIKDGGPSNAISVCSVRAPQIASDLSDPDGWSVGRTSHRTRNPDNAPDDWEAKVLEEFRQRAMAGEGLERMEKAELMKSDEGHLYRYMKAIPVGKVCLTCHGSNVAPALKAQIKAYYPEDQATGFELGELRGAFTITKAVPN